MKVRHSRQRWIRNQAWAMIAALMPASECLAYYDSDPAGAASSQTTPSIKRSIIPPPRRFSDQEIKKRSAKVAPPATRQASAHQEAAATENPRPIAVEEILASTPRNDAPTAAPAPESLTEPTPIAIDLTAARPKETAAPQTDAEPALAITPAAEAPAAEEAPSPIPMPVKAPAAPTAPAPEAIAPVEVEAETESLKLQDSPEAAPAPQPEPSASEKLLTEALSILNETGGASRPSDPIAPQTPQALDNAPVPAEIPQGGDAAATPDEAQAEAASDTYANIGAEVIAAIHGDPATPAAAPAEAAPAQRTRDEDVEPTECTSCGGFHSRLAGHSMGSSGGCAAGNCVPGRGPCFPPENECDTVVGAFMSNLYQAICCPDPCYEPGWDPVAYASLFADYARPRTVTRIRVDRGINMTNPNRNEFFLKQTNPSFPRTINRGGRSLRVLTDPSLNWSQLYLYQEAAGEKGSFFVEYPYRQINPLFSPTQAGFGDINFGTKSMMFDTELLQVAFQFRTYMPTGNANNGLGTGHVSLDPSILTSLKLGPETYFQAQVGQWIPLGGTPNISGGLLYWFMSVNQVLWWCTPDSPLIGTLEMDGWSFQDGGYYSPPVIAQTQVGTGPHGYPIYRPASNPLPGQHAGVVNSGGGVSYFNIGPGLRWSICNKVDLGGALTWATTSGQWASPWFRFEVRFLF